MRAGSARSGTPTSSWPRPYSRPRSGFDARPHGSAYRPGRTRLDLKRASTPTVRRVTVTSSPETPTPRERGGILAPAYLATTIGVFALIAFNAFEAMAVTTVMPTISRDLDGLGLYALAFAAPLASGVVGMVAAGSWSDRRGPAGPLVVSLVLFSARRPRPAASRPSMEVLVAGRVVQGLGTGALIVSLYVVVGVVYPPGSSPRSSPASRRRGCCPRCSARRWRPWSPRRSAGAGSSSGSSALVVLAAVLIAPVVPGAARACRRGNGRHRARSSGGPRWRRLPCSPSSCSGRAARRCCRPLAAAPRWCSRSSPSGRYPARHPARRPRAAVGDRHPRPDERGVLLLPGLHRARAAGAVGPHRGPGRHRADRRGRRVGLGQPGSGAAA